MDEHRVEVGRTAASVAEMVIELVDTANKFGRDWRPTLSEFIELRLQRFVSLHVMDRERLGQLIYEAVYADQGGRWECVEPREVWYAKADWLMEQLANDKAEGRS